MESVYDDKDLTADVAGNGIVLPEKAKGIAPEPKPTKGLSRKGLFIASSAVALLVGGIVFGISTTPTAPKSSGVGAGGDDEGAGQVATVGNAPDVRASAAASASAVPNSASVAVQPPPGPATAAPPSPREQYLEWREKHYYDRLRARLTAEDQAYTAKLLDDAASPSAGLRGLQKVAAATGAMGRPTAAAAAAAPVAEARERSLDADRAALREMVRHEVAKVAPAAAQTPATTTDDGYLQNTVRDKRPGYEIAAGTIIPAVLLSAINSDLPGSIIAQVRQPVYDTFDYRKLLIPAGTRIVGRYSSDINYGQERVMVAWDEMIFPNGRRINIAGMPGTDAQGASGMRDKVDTHFWRTWGNALLVSLIGAAAQQAQPQNQGTFNTPTASQQATAAAANSLNETASQVLRKNLNVAPTLEIRPGYLFNIMVNKSVSLPEYKE
ncbi:TrbI/VirB10 family protein [Tepidimonas charontis]|uniref:Type IV secretion system protein PtlG n=1 Tax=Tepidimonas charontis TaxID=2267262 RepID=A0A554X503_9BURK|nr:TrbI/VirB10 family protein [Tepidimonas charontis]TSE30912.1 Type IV secretion system protein PtlG [Tepidimonas charontis]